MHVVASERSSLREACLAVLVALVAMLAPLVGPPTASAAAPALEIGSTSLPAAGVPVNGRAVDLLAVSNSGDAPLTAEPLTIDFQLSAGRRFVAATDELKQSFSSEVWHCTPAPNLTSGRCSLDQELLALHAAFAPIGPGEEPCVGLLGRTCRLLIVSAPEASVAVGQHLSATFEACGAGSPSCALGMSETSVVPHFEITNFDGGVFEEAGWVATQAGSHPHTAMSTFDLTQTAGADGFIYSTEDLRDNIVDLPPGLVGDFSEIPTCADTDLTAEGSEPNCPPASQVGVITLFLTGSISESPGEVRMLDFPIFNMEPPTGHGALFGFNAEGTVAHFTGDLRIDRDVPGGYRLRLMMLNAAQTLPVVGSRVTLWGVPADDSHDDDRVGPASEPRLPVLTLPTSCEGAVQTALSIRTWQGGTDRASFLSHDPSDPLNPIGVDGCERVEFSPTLIARPTSDIADYPTGLHAQLHLPQNEDPDGTATGHLRSAVVRLPAGLVVNPSGANGLGSCSASEIALDSEERAGCPDSSKLGSVEIVTPLLDSPARGAVYLADPFDNPFNSLLALYVVADSASAGIVIKLAGEVEADPGSGRLTVTFLDNPQLPLEDLRLKLFEGPVAPLRTPLVCAEYMTTSTLTPWSAPESGPPATPRDGWTISQTPEGVSCAGSAQPPPPSLDAGTVSPIAGARTPFVLALGREARTAAFESLSLTTPPGLVANLSGVPRCPGAVLASIESDPMNPGIAPCPAASRIGSATVGAGAGPRPLYVDGGVYLAGPYGGAPLSLAVVLRGLAGPFDLGLFVVRFAAHVNPRTASLRLVSDTLPVLRSGVPLDIRRINLSLDRPGFIRNPTSCGPTEIASTVRAVDGTTTTPASRFQVGGCASLGFKPRIRIGFSGALVRHGHPDLAIDLAMRTADSSIADASFTLPAGELLDIRRIRVLCPRPLPAEGCPPGSSLGWARLDSPLVDDPLEGPIYLRAPSRRLPDLLVDLRSDWLHVRINGHTSAPPGRLRVRFPAIPDVPLSRAHFRLRGGRHGILVNSESLCARPRGAVAKLGSHSGTYRELRPKVRLRGRC